MNARIAALDYYLPERIEDAEALQRAQPAWSVPAILDRTGVEHRHLAAKGETAADLAFVAAERLFAQGVDRADIDFLLLVTQSPDYALPTTACLLQDRLGLPKTCMAMDLNLGCSGFVYGLSVGSALIASGQARRGLLLCADTYSRYIHPDDRSVRPLFSDAGAVALLTAAEPSGLGAFALGTDGSGYRNLMVAGSGARIPDEDQRAGWLSMNGAQVLMFTMDAVPRCVDQVLTKAGCGVDDVDLFVFHQASKVVLDNIVRRLGLPEDKVYRNYRRVGNTVSASIPIALKDAQAEGRLKPGDRALLMGFGVGYSWGGCLAAW